MRTLVADVDNVTGHDLVSWESCLVGKRMRKTCGNSWKSLRSFLAQHGGTFYAYGLDFLGRFLVMRLMSDGFRWVKNGFAYTNMEFQTLFSELGQCYSISWRENGMTIRLCDYSKLVRADMRDVLEAFPGVHDRSEVMAQSLLEFEQLGIHGMTIAQAALTDYRKMIGREEFYRHYPKVGLSVQFDNDVRNAYHGGYCDVNSAFANKDLQGVYIYDVKSLYPSILKRYPLPCGMPLEFDGEPPAESALWIANVRLSATLKPTGIPFLRIKHNPMFNPFSYVSDTCGVVNLWISSVDFLALTENYDVEVYGFGGGYCFVESAHMFDDYVDKWYGLKESSEGMRKISCKLMLNSLIGKFGANVVLRDQEPVITAGYLDFELGDTHFRDGVYLPVSVFVNAFGRLELTRAIRSAGKLNWVYSDTDSLHLLAPAEDGEFKLGDNLGELSLKGIADDARYLSRKRYALRTDGVTSIVCAGMPGNIMERISYDDFRVGWTNANEDGTLKAGYELWKAYPVKGGMVKRPYVFNL